MDTPALPTHTPAGSPAAGIEATEVSMCVLSSSSSGNCTVLRWRENGSPRCVLIDAGLSPKKTKNWLRGVGTNLAQVDTMMLTHLDRDHCHIGWSGGRVPPHIKLMLHGRHLRRAEREAMLHQRTEPFNEEFKLSPAVTVKTIMLSHDDLGVASFCFEFASPSTPRGKVTLGFATDLGRVTEELVACMQGVDVLAVESNYCPRMQDESDRPAFLKRRITGGRGHLSNEQCLEAIDLIAPREHVVLLHLSRECNHPDLVASLHADSPYAVTIAKPDRPTRWIHVGIPTPGLSEAPRRRIIPHEGRRPLVQIGAVVRKHPTLWETVQPEAQLSSA
ncbi:MAG TPA: MBL fold metallo-hydrolase [Phycisphaerales bacterium]|nr:MBL fold metallo-hydrolase [Phycisphaerales bacterium]